MPVGAEKPEIQELPRIRERLSFIYLEYCEITRDDSGLCSRNKLGTVNIPIASIAVLLLGPGTSITHRAMELIGDVGSSVVWVGEHGVKYYANGRSIAQSSSMLTRQAEYVSNKRKRLAVAREMYCMRFPSEDVSRLTMQQLRGREGARVRAAYRRISKETGVPWNGRSYSYDNFGTGDTVNKALSMANACLYGVVHSVIVAMGCSPGLGFVHTGSQRSFVYDIADLYKTEISVPVAFRVAASNPPNLYSATRRAVRDIAVTSNLMERVADDIRYLLNAGTDEDTEEAKSELWDESGNNVRAGQSYSDD